MDLSVQNSHRPFRVSVWTFLSNFVNRKLFHAATQLAFAGLHFRGEGATVEVLGVDVLVLRQRDDTLTAAAWQLIKRHF